MEDRIDEVLALLGNDKKNLIKLLIIYILVMIVVIVIIWWPKEKDYATYNSINIETIKTEQAQKYMNAILRTFKNSNKSRVEELISDGYAKYVKKTKLEIVEELEQLGCFSNDVRIEGMNIYTNEDTYIYSTTIYAGDKSRKINIVETYPYIYELAFDEFYAYEKINKTIQSNDIQINISNCYKRLNYVELDVRIQNFNELDAKFNFTTTTGVEAVLEDGTAYPLIGMASAGTETTISSSTMLNEKLVFGVPVQLQNAISYIVFNNVVIGTEKYDIVVQM